MIKRRYFYHCTFHGIKPKFANGLFTVTSWLPNQNAAYDLMYELVCDAFECDKSKIEVHEFYAV